MMKADDDGSAAENTRPARPAATTTEPKSSVGQKMSRGLASCGFCCFKMKEQTQISALEFKIAARQKKFGVDYLTLVERKASQPALKGCLKEALRDIAELQTQINDHYDKIDEKKGTVEQNQEDVASRNPPPVAEVGAGAKPKPKRNKPEDGGGETSAKSAGDTKKAPAKKKGTKKKKKPEGQDERFTIDE